MAMETIILTLLLLLYYYTTTKKITLTIITIIIVNINTKNKKVTMKNDTVGIIPQTVASKSA